ncbi:MAG: hypothetical protein EOO54_15290, partial [Haliea sp.]
GPQHRLPQRRLQPCDLRDVPILTMPAPSTIYVATMAWFAAGQVEPQHLSTCNSLALMARLIAAGQGIAMLPRAMVRNEVESGQLRLIDVDLAISSGTLVVAFAGPSHRYRPLIQTIQEALHDSELIAPL